MPTFAALANASLPNRIIDGRNIAQVLLEPEAADSPHQFLWHYCGDNVTAGTVTSIFYS